MENLINPIFTDLNANTVLSHLKQITSTNSVSHSDILQTLISEIKPVDYQSLAYPEATDLKKRLLLSEKDSEEALSIQSKLDSFKISEKHHLILTVENVIEQAELNDWGICKQDCYIYSFNGCYWKVLDKELFQSFLGQSAEKMGVAKFSAKHFQFREKLFKQFLSTGYLQKPETNKNTVLINLLNGTFEISGKKSILRNFDRTDFLNYQLPFEYNAQANAPMFEAYLNKVLPDIAMQNILAEYLGYVFLKQGSEGLKLEKALILYGSGANGKSVFYEVVNALLGAENTSNYSLQSLTDENGYYRAKIANKLVNYSSEINGKLESSIFKQLVSCEPVGARLPYGEPFEIQEYAKMIFNCNELPKDVEHTNAYFRRFLIIPFEVTIPDNERDTQLSNKIIKNELSGVFNWVLKGLERLLEQKNFTQSDKVNNVLEEYKIQSDSVKMFLEDYGFSKSSNDYVLIKELYILYRAFCNDDGCKPVNKKNFIKRLESDNVNVKRINKGNIAYVSSKEYLI